MVGRGTVAQAVIGTLVSFYFFAISYKERPFIEPGLNLVKVFSELQLFCILLICTTLQANTAVPDFIDEPITAEDYGNVLTGLTLAILPVSIYFLYTHNFKAEEEIPEIDSKEHPEGPAGLSRDIIKNMNRGELEAKLQELELWTWRDNKWAKFVFVQKKHNKRMRKRLIRWLRQQVMADPAYKEMKALELEREDDEKCKRLFERYDDDGGGEIDATELGDIFNSLGKPMGEEELAEVLKTIDTDGSGTVNFDEFRTMWKANSAKYDEDNAPKHPLANMMAARDKVQAQIQARRQATAGAEGGPSGDSGGNSENPTSPEESKRDFDVFDIEAAEDEAGDFANPLAASRSATDDASTGNTASAAQDEPGTDFGAAGKAGAEDEV
eukprot:SAG22_NODE_381_length_11354_cov_6.529631_2_plen_383_part_00